VIRVRADAANQMPRTWTERCREPGPRCKRCKARRFAAVHHSPRMNVKPGAMRRTIDKGAQQLAASPHPTRDLHKRPGATRFCGAGLGGPGLAASKSGHPALAAAAHEERQHAP
jgi:hypothetical protein